jgi:hypothetical protein
VRQPGEYIFFRDEPPEDDCTICHKPPGMEVILDIQRFVNPDDRRCDTCHHNPGSFINSQIEAIAGALSDASQAWSDAEAKLARAKQLGMLVPGADVTLTEARTAYLQAQAAVHTTKLIDVTVHTDEAIAKAESAEALAQVKIDDSIFRRKAMVTVIVVILINIVIMFGLKLQIDRDRRRGRKAEPPRT